MELGDACKSLKIESVSLDNLKMKLIDIYRSSNDILSLIQLVEGK
jgi:hypothetical protein